MGVFFDQLVPLELVNIGVGRGEGGAQVVVGVVDLTHARSQKPSSSPSTTPPPILS